MNRMALDRQMSVVYFDCKIKPRERAGITGNDIHRLFRTRMFSRLFSLCLGDLYARYST